jgi:hypothetical protein
MKLKCETQIYCLKILKLFNEHSTKVLKNFLSSLGQCIVSSGNDMNRCASGICVTAIDFEKNQTERQCEKSPQNIIQFVVGMKIILERNAQKE